MIYYRYLSEKYALAALQKQQWKVARVLELNDALDCRPVIYQNGKPLDPSKPAPPAIQKSYESIGIICYSRSVEDPMIWSHYGDNHTGIALGFDFTSRPPRKVNYPTDNRRFEIDADNLPAAYLSLKSGFKKLEEAFSEKAHSWEHEKEFRHFILLSDCKMDGAHYFRPVPMESLRNVVIGLHTKCSPYDIKRLLCPQDSKPETHFTNVQIYKAKIDYEKYRVIPEEVSLDDFELD